MSNKKMEEAINKLSSFINSLRNIDDSSSETGFDLFFSIADEGTLFLSGEEARDYREVVKLLIDSIKDEIISKKAIETLLQKAILLVLDIREQRKEKSFEQRLEDALADLRKSLNAVPVDFNVYYPVHGLEINGLPIHIGNVQFCIFDEEHLAVFTKLLNGTAGDKDSKGVTAYIADQIKQAEINGKTVGLVDVKAIEPESAKLLALKELSLTMDVVNFFSDLIPYNNGYLYLPGDNEQLLIDILVISKDDRPKWTFGQSRVGQIMPFSFTKLLEANNKSKLGFKKISNLLSKQRNGLEDRIITAMRWAGKATVERKKEESFLLYAISLESLILADLDQGELSYRLRQRVAHLIGKPDKESRERISNNIRNLYEIRSKIIHSGYYQVTDADLSLIRSYAKGSILKILNKRPFSTMESVISLANWFNRKILE